MTPYNRFIALICLLCCSAYSHSQLSFPLGSTLNLVTTSDYLYEETGIIFNTGKYKITDYQFQRISDSLDQRWTISSCMNGECLNDLPDNGSYKIFNRASDTVGYQRFHVSTNGFEGTSKIVYQVSNKNNMFDVATLVFYITYRKTNSIALVRTPALKCYPVPAHNQLTIQTEYYDQIAQIWLFDAEGKFIPLEFSKDANQVLIDLESVNSGLYYLSVVTKEGSFNRPIVIQH